jgi:hypothetical protein
MRLSEKQQIFTACIGKLILFASSKEYGLTQGDGYRDPRVFGEMGEKRSYASKNSVHKIRLAHDFNLFVKGEFISDGGHPAWLELGEHWECLHKDARWGGRFDDANHFSFEHWGCK